MSRADWTRLGQAVLIMLQVANGGLATVHASPEIALTIAALLAGLQYMVHEAAVQTPPPQENK